ncbi:collagenase-like protease, partial [Enterococcus faecalis]
MSMRDANRGGFSPSCRLKYEFFYMPFWAERRGKTSEGGGGEEVFISAVEIAMNGQISELN